MACEAISVPLALAITPLRTASGIGRRRLRRFDSSLVTTASCNRRLSRSASRKDVQTGAPQAGFKHERAGHMLQHEESLPSLPVPSLHQTAEKYLKSVRPLLSARDFGRTKSAVHAFVEPDGPGPVLQKRLEARRQDPDVLNWLSEQFNREAYMGFREPVIPSTSYFFSFMDDPKRKDPVKRAAAVSRAVLEFKDLVVNETLSSDYVRETPQTMDGYRFLFNSCRVPAKSCDVTETYDPKEHQHILVVRKNVFFKVMHEYQGVQLNTSELEDQFKQVYAIAEREDDHGVGILTAENRDVWADARQRLAQVSTANRQALIDIESASFVVCLDDAAPFSLNKRARQYFLGNSCNRWYDKPVNFIVCDSGAMGYYGEHSWIDGGLVLRLTDTVLKQTLREDLSIDSGTVRSHIPGPQVIKFDLTPENIQDIKNAKTRFDVMSSQQRNYVEQIDYGKNTIKSLKCPPDAYVQLVIQLAYKILSGQSRPTYESASTRRFRNARTEACRIVSEETIEFCDSMQNSSSTDESRRSLFKKAVGAILQIQKHANEGQGIDRHLFGLKYAIRQDEEVPEIFKDPAFTYSQNWVITSSQVSSEYWNGFGFAQAMPEGFGIAYMINADLMQFNIASQIQDCERMGHLLNQAANEIHNLLK